MTDQDRSRSAESAAPVPADNVSEARQAAGVVRSSGLPTVGWVWECALCDERGNAHFSSGAHANLLNHITREHISWVQGLGAPHNERGTQARNPYRYDGSGNV